ncbi:hypothetical protein CEXT_484511 [Caerostris extrusa]|uniref:C2H2-type domain-containing protein n=1 Tax=Caerostris extrusa TaxID=172846 RepID=A0AAV4Y7L5_CAEEX|nr:hypothetical protein CEXT_484511 [Caerostris extrusa]
MFFYFTDAGISLAEIATSAKRHQCPSCEYTSFRPADMKKHIRLHTGEEPYKCTVCMKGFKQKCNLNSHMRTHTGDLPSVVRCVTKLSPGEAT